MLKKKLSLIVIFFLINITSIKPKTAGIKNFGNTCYLNSAIQLLANSKMGNIITNLKKTNDPLLQKVQTVINHIKTDTNPFNENQVIDNIVNSIFSQKGSQQDSCQILEPILNKIQEASPELAEKNFQISMLSTKTCSKCSRKDTSESMNNMFRLPQPKHINAKKLQDLLDKEYKESEKIEEYFCKECKEKVTATSITKILTAPENLFMQIKRFKKQNNTFEKDSTSVTIPKEINLSEYMYNGVQELKYKFKGIVLHSGSYSGGHYTAIVDNYFYDDNRVTQISEQELSTILANGKKGDSTPYILLYEKEDTPTPKINISEGDTPQALQTTTNKINNEIDNIFDKLGQLETEIDKTQNLINEIIKK